MTVPFGYRLGVDFGTSTTIAMLQWPDGRVRPLLFDGSPLLSSAVFLGVDGRLYTGRDATHLARGNPERLEPNPKRRIDDGTLLLGNAEVPVRDLISTVLRRIAVEAGQVAGQPSDVVLTHPAAWGAGRRGLLVEAAELAGLGRPRLVSEPLAAATYLAQGRADLVPGSCVLVYDLGAGTCDITLLRRHPQGFHVVASDGLNEVGGLDVDAAIVAFLGATYGQLWNDAITHRQVWDEVRTAKEMLSRASGTVVTIPGLGREVPLGREQFEGLARPVLRPTIAMAKGLLREANVDAVAALFLVGGSSKIPLVGTLLHEALGVAPIVTEQPELVVAEGALFAAPTVASALPQGPPGSAPVTGAPVTGAPVTGVPVTGVPVTGAPVTGAAMPPRQQRRGVAVLAVVASTALLVLLGGATGGYLLLKQKSGGSANPGVSASASHAPSASAVPIKYIAGKLPQNICEKIDIGTLGTTFEKASSAPVGSRYLNTIVGTFSCLIGREHDASGTYVSTGSLNVTVSVYTDGNMAATTYRTIFDSAKLNGPVTEISGVGDHAFIFQQPVPSGGSNGVATFELDARDANLTWNISLTVSQMSTTGWSDRDRAKFKDQLVAALKASIANVAKS